MTRLDETRREALETDTQGAIKRMRDRVDNDGSALATELARLQKMMTGKVDEKRLEEHIGILSAKLGEQKPLHAVETKDLAQAVLGIEAMLNELGFEFGELEKFSPSEQKMIDDAKKAIADAEVKLTAAQQSMFFWRESRTATAQAELNASKTALETATNEAKRLQRERLMNADMASSLQTFQVRVEETIGIMQERTVAIATELKAVAGAKERAHKVGMESVRQYEKVKKSVESLKTQITRAEAELKDLENGTEARKAAETRLSELQRKLVETEGEMSQALGVMQSKEKFAKELEIHETAQQKLLDNHRMWIAVLKSDSEERVVTFHSRLEAMKADADQMIAQKLAETGQVVDRNNADMMARIGRASDDARMKQLEEHPERMRQMQKIREAQAEAHRAIEARFGNFIQEFEQKYGINPLHESLVSDHRPGEQKAA